jgi:hypothetical protein
VVLDELLGDLGPRLLRDDEDAHAQFRHDLHRLGRHGRGVGAAAETLEGRGADVGARLADELPVELAVALLEAFEQHPRVFHEALAALVHGHAQALELDLARAPPQPQDHPAAR